MLRSAFKPLLALPVLFPVFPASAQTFTNASVPSTANIYSAGNSGSLPGGGTAAPGFQIDASSVYVHFTAVSGMASLSTGISTVPDGLLSDGTAPFGLSLDVASSQGISGIRLDAGSGFLSGVFINDSTPTDPAPASLLFTNNATSGSIPVDFTELHPLLNQQFFIGDGLTGNGTGDLQNFFIPAGATRLFLGFADANGYNGAPSAYFDNSGGLTVSLTASVPAPSALLTLLMGAFPGATLILRRRRN